MPLFGVDLGGTKIEAVVIDTIDPVSTVFRERITTPQADGYNAIIGAICELVKRAAKEASCKPQRLGIGTPGTIDPRTQLLRGSNTVSLNGKPFKSDLEARLGLPVVIENDANCFTLAEATLGAGVGHRTVFGVIMGTGVGGGIVIDGRVHSGRQGIAGEWGHNYLEPDGSPCYCGKAGDVETVLSGTGLQRYYRSISNSDQISLKEIWSRTSGKDPAAIATMDRFIDYFGRAIATVINILDPDIIVLGGGVSNTRELYDRGIQSAMKHIFNPSPDIRIVKHTLGDSAGVFGAAMLAAD